MGWHPYQRLMYAKLITFVCLMLGQLLRWVQINRVCDATGEESDFIVKHRKWYARFPIWIGNFVFRFRKPRITVLSNAAWLAWEQQVERSTGRSALATTSNTATDRERAEMFRFPKIPGVPLTRLLKQEHISPTNAGGDATATSSDHEEQKLQYVGWAARELHHFHQLSVDGSYPAESAVANFLATEHPGSPTPFSQIRLSHADATITNVMIDLKGERAIWFDFDLRHDLATPAVERHADDLRAFLFSVVVSMKWNDLNQVLQWIKKEYPTTAVWQRLQKQVAEGGIQHDWFHWAQLARCRGEAWHNARVLCRMLAAMAVEND